MQPAIRVNPTLLEWASFRLLEEVDSGMPILLSDWHGRAWEAGFSGLNRPELLALIHDLVCLPWGIVDERTPLVLGFRARVKAAFGRAAEQMMTSRQLSAKRTRNIVVSAVTEMMNARPDAVGEGVLSWTQELDGIPITTSIDFGGRSYSFGYFHDVPSILGWSGISQLSLGRAWGLMRTTWTAFSEDECLRQTEVLRSSIEMFLTDRPWTPPESGQRPRWTSRQQ